MNAYHYLVSSRATLSIFSRRCSGRNKRDGAKGHDDQIARAVNTEHAIILGEN